MQSQLRQIVYKATSAINRVSGGNRVLPTSIEFPNYVCNSIGGVASTSVFDFLTDSLPKVTENHFARGASQWKHTPFPPISPSIRKGIFIFGDPLQATVSLFRRNLCRVHLSNKGLPSFQMTLEEYLELSHDVFRTSEHIANWTAGSPQYPILCVKSDVVFEHAAEICDFFGIGAKRGNFPVRQERNISKDLGEIIGEKKREKLEAILSDAVRLYTDLPEFFIASPKSDEPTGS